MRGLNKSGKLPVYERGMTVYCDWRTTFHYHNAWRSMGQLVTWKLEEESLVSTYAMWFRYFQGFLISLCHATPQTVFIPIFKGDL
jgi:hypothetical protein